MSPNEHNYQVISQYVGWKLFYREYFWAYSCSLIRQMNWGFRILKLLVDSTLLSLCLHRKSSCCSRPGPKLVRTCAANTWETVLRQPIEGPMFETSLGCGPRTPIQRYGETWKYTRFVTSETWCLRWEVLLVVRTCSSFRIPGWGLFRWRDFHCHVPSPFL